MSNWKLGASSAAMVMLLSTTALAAELTCGAYNRLSDGQKISLAYGYLAGIQAALDKEEPDVLVPTSNPKHPIWWVLPSELGDNVFLGIGQALSRYCRSSKQSEKGLVDAFLSIARNHDGNPSLGISFDKKKTDAFKRILGGQSVTCSGYVSSGEGTRQAIIDGYYVGTEALRIGLKRSFTTGLAWPSKASRRAVRLEVDKRCEQAKRANLNDILWVTTTEMAVKQE
jgi:hypothetical protein